MSELFLSREDDSEEELAELEREIKNSPATEVSKPAADQELQDVIKRKREQGLSYGCPTPELMTDEKQVPIETPLEDIASEETPSAAPLMEVKKGELELEFDIPKDLENKIIVKENDQIVEYVGRIYNLHIRPDSSFFGNITLTKSILTNEKKKKFVRLFPPTLELTTVTKRKKLWEIKKDPHRWYSFGTLLSGNYDKAGYRQHFKNLALNAKKLLTNNLLEAVFGPLDKQLEKIYTTLKKEKDSNS